MFAKIYNTADFGQVLLMKDEDDNGAPELVVACQPKGFGTCKLKFGYSDDEDGWNKLDEAFETLGFEFAYKGAAQMHEMLGVG